jgi:hypothetical protein
MHVMRRKRQGRPKGTGKNTPEMVGDLYWDSQLILEDWERFRSSTLRIIERADKGKCCTVPKRLVKKGVSKKFLASQLVQYPEYRHIPEEEVRKLLSNEYERESRRRAGTKEKPVAVLLWGSPRANDGHKPRKTVLLSRDDLAAIAEFNARKWKHILDNQ